MSTDNFRDLIDGYKAFRKTHYAIDAGRYRDLATSGQTPRTMVIACSDSRVDPARIFDARPGELFVVRNVANLVPPCEAGGVYHGTSAAIQFAVEMLKVERVLIMGHARCGGVGAFLEGAATGRTPDSFIEKWISLLGPAYEALLASGLPEDQEARQRLMEKVSVTQSIDNLLSFPFVQAAVSERNLKLQGGFFDIFTGQLQLLDPQTNQFAPIATET